MATDRIDRMARALALAGPLNAAHQYFSSLSHHVQSQITRKREELRAIPATDSRAKDIQLELAQLETELDRMQYRNETVAEMVFRTIRDTYNQDADTDSRVM